MAFGVMELQEKPTEISLLITTAKRHCCLLTIVLLLGMMTVVLTVILAVNQAESRIPQHSLFSSCPREWIGFGNQCFYFSEDTRNWTSSQDFCASSGANLATFDTIHDLNFLKRHKDLYDHWIGLRRESSKHSWKWADNTNFTNLVEVRGSGEYAYLNEAGISSARVYAERKWICSKPSLYAQCPAASSSLLPRVSSIYCLLVAGILIAHA
ncbi:C-type lectin domain family 2 member D11-like [Thomomys bottae]